ncbi:MAG: hypothetical protein ACOYNZ_08930 [Rhodoferax sp.]
MQSDPTPASGSGALTRALDDPQVGTLARSLRLDLEDPVTLNALLAMTQRHVNASSEIDSKHKQMLIRTLTPGQSRHARAAIAAYREIAALSWVAADLA